MDAVLRALVIYFVLVLLFRITGKRSLGQITTFDLVLLLIIAEATQQGLLGNDFSLTNAVIVIATLIGVDIGLSLLKQRSPTLGLLFDSAPLVLIQDGRIHRQRLDRARLDEADILNAAREKQGLERLDQIKYAVLEANGGISVVPKR